MCKYLLLKVLIYHKALEQSPRESGLICYILPGANKVLVKQCTDSKKESKC
jgi:hypothetical protein